MTALPALTLVMTAQLLACKGPERDVRSAAIELPDPTPLVVQWLDGPRRDNAEREMEREAQRMAARLFRAEPMAREVAGDDERVEGEEREGRAAERAALPERPSWADGVERPADNGASSLPQGWPIVVRRGETPAVLSEWSGVEVAALIENNKEALRGRKWFKVGDRLTITMSADAKVRFDRQREKFQEARVGAYFANRYFEKVVVYRVKKGEFVARAAKRYGDVPLWLIEEFNQMDFRALQPGDEILIPVVGQLPPGRRQPPPPLVVDEEGHPLSEAHAGALEARLRNDMFAKARMALDDSNVFARPRVGGDSPALAAEVAVAPMVQPVQGAGYPRPERALPPASIGGGLLPNYARSPEAPSPGLSGRAESPGVVIAERPAPAAVVPAAPAPQPAALMPRDVVVRRGESLMHYVMWSKTSLDTIKAANQGRIDGDRIFIGARLTIPMTEAGFVNFVTARAEWEKEKALEQAGGGKAEEAKGGARGDKAQEPRTKKYSVKSGETATSIAHKHRLTVKELRTVNPGVNLSRLRVGQKLVIPLSRK